MSARRIILVEDEPDMAELVAMRLRREGFAVEVVGDGATALEKVRAAPPDLVLLDLMLPGISGIDVATAIRADPRTAGVPIIMLTARAEESDVVIGLKLGADDYITKPFNLSVLLARIEAVLRRAAALRAAAPGSLRVGEISIDLQRHEVEVARQPVGLTLTEFKLLAALAAAQGRVLTRNQLMDQAMGAEVTVTDRTIDVHVTSLRKKLGPARDCLRTIRGVGYKLVATQGHDLPQEA